MASYYGDVWPARPVGFNATDVGLDFDQDGDEDAISSGGNQIVTDGINLTDPTATTGTGLPWDAQQVWRNWDSDHDVEVGRTGLGVLTVFAGEAMRPRHLVIGRDAGSVGSVSITGDGTHFSNSRENIPQAVKVAIELGQAAAGSDAAAFWARVEAITYDEIGATDAGSPFAEFVRRAKGAWDVIVGRAGAGHLTVGSGALFEVEHRLLVGGYYNDDETPLWVPGESGSVIFDSITGIVYGVYYADSESSPTDGTPSRFAANALVEMRQTMIEFRQGLQNDGRIVIRTGETPTVIVGDLTNNGEIYVEAGATLIYKGAYSAAGGGRVVRAKCGAPSVIIGIDGVEALPSEKVMAA